MKSKLNEQTSQGSSEANSLFRTMEKETLLVSKKLDFSSCEKDKISEKEMVDEEEEVLKR